MYHEFYNLEVLPFENTPDPRFFFASEQHREALAAIEYTIRMRKGFVLITGDIGSGKTTVGRTMCERCGDQATIVHVGWGHQDRNGLIRQILRNLNVKSSRSDDHGRLLDRLGKHLTEQLQLDRPVVLFVDEAQTLSDEALEELRLLSNFDTAGDKLLQIALVGQPELRQRIRLPQHAALRQRIVMAKQLHPLNLAETHQYIVHRLRSAAAQGQVPRVQFDGEAVRQIFASTGGVPRLINVTCDNCLLLGYVRETPLIDASIVRRVLDDMIPNLEDDGQASQRAIAPMRLAGNF